MKKCHSFDQLNKGLLTLKYILIRHKILFIFYSLNHFIYYQKRLKQQIPNCGKCNITDSKIAVYLAKGTQFPSLKKSNAF